VEVLPPALGQARGVWWGWCRVALLLRSSHEDHCAARAQEP
jgi:hypothetical protein